jgi:hypothetical protein
MYVLYPRSCMSKDGARLIPAMKETETIDDLARAGLYAEAGGQSQLTALYL